MLVLFVQELEPVLALEVAGYSRLVAVPDGAVAYDAKGCCHAVGASARETGKEDRHGFRARCGWVDARS